MEPLEARLIEAMVNRDITVYAVGEVEMFHMTIAQRLIPAMVPVRRRALTLKCWPGMRRSSFIILLLLLGIGQSAFAATGRFYYYNRLCVSVIDLRDDHKYTFRDDLGGALISQLRQFATQANFRIAIESRQQCQKPDDPGYARQMRFDLSIKRQIAELDGAKKHIVVIDGSSPNAQGALSAYELMPIVIIQDSPIEEREILKILAEFTHKKVLTRRDSSTK